MIALSRKALVDLERLLAHYETLGRPAASRNLLTVLERAKTRIAAAPDAGLPAPRPYKTLVKPGRLWIIEGSYWISYRTTKPPIILGVFYATANIPERL